MPPLSIGSPRGQTVAVVLGMAITWAVATLVCIMVISMPDSLGAAHQVSFSRAVFTAVNSATQSGFTQQFAGRDDFAPLARRALSITSVVGIIFSLAAGAIVLRRVLDLPIRLLHVVIAIALLLIISGMSGVSGLPETPLVDRVFGGIDALGGAGQTQHLVGWTATGVKLLLTPLAMVGSLGALGVIAILRIGDGGRVLFDVHVRKVLLVAAAVYVAGLIVNFALLAAPGTLADALQSASSVTLAARGFGTPADFASAWARGMEFVVLAIALIGVGSLGTMPSLGFAWLATLPRRFWPVILILLGIQGSLMLAALLALSRTELQLPLERILLLVVSAAGKTGLSHEAISIDGPGLLILAALMAISKVLPLGLLWATRRADIQ